MNKASIVTFLRKRSYMEELKKRRHTLTEKRIRLNSIFALLGAALWWGTWQMLLLMLLINISILLMTLNANKVAEKPVPNILRYQIIASLGMLIALAGLVAEYKEILNALDGVVSWIQT